VFATDVDQGSINVGRAAIYPETITADVSQNRLRQFFSRAGTGYRLKPTVREMVVFGQQDLLKDPPFSRLDLISCRNLLIYLNAEARRRVRHFLFCAEREGNPLSGHLGVGRGRQYSIYYTGEEIQALCA